MVRVYNAIHTEHNSFAWRSKLKSTAITRQLSRIANFLLRHFSSRVRYRHFDKVLHSTSWVFRDRSRYRVRGEIHSLENEVHILEWRDPIWKPFTFVPWPKESSSTALRIISKIRRPDDTISIKLRPLSRPRIRWIAFEKLSKIKRPIVIQARLTRLELNAKRLCMLSKYFVAYRFSLARLSRHCSSNSIYFMKAFAASRSLVNETI